MNHKSIILFLFFIYMIIIIFSTLIYQKYGFVGDACVHVSLTHQILGLPPTEPTIERNDGFFCPIYNYDKTYPATFHYFTSKILTFTNNNDYLTFLVIIPAIFLLFPVGFIFLFKFWYKLDIIISSMNFTFFPLFIKQMTNSVYYTRFSVMILLVWSVFIIIYILRFKTKLRFLILLSVAVISIPILTSFHRIPNPTSYQDMLTLAIDTSYISPFIFAYLFSQVKSETFKKIFKVSFLILFFNIFIYSMQIIQLIS